MVNLGPQYVNQQAVLPRRQYIRETNHREHLAFVGVAKNGNQIGAPRWASDIYGKEAFVKAYCAVIEAELGFTDATLTAKIGMSLSSLVNLVLNLLAKGENVGQQGRPKAQRYDVVLSTPFSRGGNYGAMLATAALAAGGWMAWTPNSASFLEVIRATAKLDLDLSGIMGNDLSPQANAQLMQQMQALQSDEVTQIIWSLNYFDQLCRTNIWLFCQAPDGQIGEGQKLEKALFVAANALRERLTGEKQRIASPKLQYVWEEVPKEGRVMSVPPELLANHINFTDLFGDPGAPKNILEFRLSPHQQKAGLWRITIEDTSPYGLPDVELTLGGGTCSTARMIYVPLPNGIASQMSNSGGTKVRIARKDMANQQDATVAAFVLNEMQAPRMVQVALHEEASELGDVRIHRNAGYNATSHTYPPGKSLVLYEGASFPMVADQSANNLMLMKMGMMNMIGDPQAQRAAMMAQLEKIEQMRAQLRAA